jgi:hypothetical protein
MGLRNADLFYYFETYGGNMNRLDLIIDALQKLDNQAHVNDMDLIADALAAARELKALEPVGWFDWDATQELWVQVYPNTHGKQLYALEVTK